MLWSIVGDSVSFGQEADNHPFHIESAQRLHQTRGFHHVGEGLIYLTKAFEHQTSVVVGGGVSRVNPNSLAEILDGLLKIA